MIQYTDLSLIKDEVQKQHLIVVYLLTSVGLFQIQWFEKREETSLIALRAVWRVQAFCFWAFVGKSYVSDVVCVAMVIIILLNDIHSELISYCQAAIKQIRLCILTVLKYFQFALNFRACEKNCSDSPGKWNTNSKGSSSCTGFLLPPQRSMHRPGYLRSRDTATDFGAWSQTLSLWFLMATVNSFHHSSAADLKSLFPDGCSSSYSNYQKLNMLAPIFHYSTRQEEVSSCWEYLLSEDKLFSSSCRPFCHHATPEDRTALWKCASAATLHPSFVTRTPVQ